MTDDNKKGSSASRNESILETGHLQSGLKKRALRGAGFSVLAQTTNYGIQTVGTIILARILSPEDFGLVAMVTVFCLLLQNFGPNGFTEVLIQKEDLTQDQMSKLFWVNFMIMSGLTILFVLLSPTISWFYREAQLKSISPWIGLSIIFSGMGTCHMALLVRNMKFHLSGLTDILAVFLSTCIAIIAAIKGIGIWSLVLRRVTQPLIASIFAWVFCGWKPGVPSKNTVIRPMLTFGFRTYGNYLMNYIRHNLDKILVGKAFGKGPIGHYDRASQLSSVLPNQLTNALSSVGIATLSRLVNDVPKYKSYFSKAISVLAFLGFPGSVLITLLGKDIILLLLGSQWETAGQIFMGFGPGIGVFVISNTNVWLHISLGRPDRLLKWGFVVLASSALSYSIGLMFGPLGVAIAYSVMFYVLLIPSLWYAGKPAAIKASFYLGVLWKYWTAAFASGFIFLLAFEFIAPVSAFYYRISPLVRVGLGVTLYPLIYLVFIGILFKGFKPLNLVVSLTKGMIAK